MAQQRVPLLDDDGVQLLDDNGNPIFDDAPIQETTPVTTSTPIVAQEQPQEQSMWQRVWDRISSPLTTAPSQIANALSEKITTPRLNEGRLSAMIRGGVGGSVEGVGNILSSMTSPIDLTAALLTGGSSLAARAGMRGAAKGLNTIARAASLPVMAHGAQTIYEAEDLGDVGQGALELAGGTLGARGQSIPDLPPVEPPKAPIRSMRERIREIEALPESMPINTPEAPLPVELELQKMLGDEQPIVDTPITRDSDFFAKNRPVQNRFEPDFTKIEGAGGDITQPVVWVFDNKTGMGQYMAPQDLNFIYDTARMEGRTLPDPPPQIKSQMSPSVFGNVERNITPIQSEILPSIKRAEQGINTEMPKTIFIKPHKNAVQSIKEATEAGYEPAGMDEKGRLKMVFTGKKQQVGPLETEIKNTRASNKTIKQPEEPSAFEEVMNFPRAIMASVDFSAPLRQGLPLIHKKEFWTSLDDMFKAWGSENAFKQIQEDIAKRPLFKTRAGADGKVLPSFAEDAGLKLSDLGDGLTSREEALQSTWAEMLPLVRRSNRAYTAFLNKLRADTFENLVSQSNIFNPTGQNNIPLAKELARFVNTASGRGSLGSLEPAAKALNATLFAPRLIASRLQMLNPHYYWAASPTVRKEALKSLLAVAGFGIGIGQLAKLAGAEVHTNPTSADFGKIRIGDTRLDPFAGFQQYAVLAARLIRGEVESTTTGNTYKLGEKFGRPTRLDILGRFVEGKMNPVLSFVTGLLRGKDFVGKPFDIPEEMASRLVPIYLQDLKEILTENPNLVPFYHDEGAYLDETGSPRLDMESDNLLAIPPLFGMGHQSYGSMK